MTTEYSVSREIAAPVERVWRLLADPGSYARWNESLVSIEGQIVEGGTVRLVPRVNPGRTFKLHVSDVQVPTRMTWSDGMPLGLFRGVRTFELADRGGSTAFSMREVYSGPLAGLIGRSIPDMTESFEQFADGLKAAAESAVKES
jgi:uncharacterized protein YndB with AHSA1/START domain